MKYNRNDIIPFKSVVVHRIWGGTRLLTEWGYETEYTDGLGECWAISCNGQVDSIVSDGIYAGKTLSWLWENEPGLFGNKKDSTFPLLVKIIDAKDNLSIQVHPDDAYAGKYENTKGKRECWYILDCPENAELIVGNNAKSRDEFAKMIEEKRWADLLRKVPVRKGDFLQIDPGTLHAISAGVELLEIQQNSDVTYRIYDYDRLSNGKPRELHIERGLAVAKIPDEYSELQIVHTDPKINKVQELVTTPDYTVWTLAVDGVATVSRLTDYFLICSVIEGNGKINGVAIEKGMHFIAPCGFPLDRIEGKLRINMAAPVYS